jgi:hypothetical protein
MTPHLDLLILADSLVVVQENYTSNALFLFLILMLYTHSCLR